MATWSDLWSLTFWEPLDLPLDPPKVTPFAEGSLKSGKLRPHRLQARLLALAFARLQVPERGADRRGAGSAFGGGGGQRPHEPPPFRAFGLRERFRSKPVVGFFPLCRLRLRKLGGGCLSFFRLVGFKGKAKGEPPCFGGSNLQKTLELGLPHQPQDLQVTRGSSLFPSPRFMALPFTTW